MCGVLCGGVVLNWGEWNNGPLEWLLAANLHKGNKNIPSTITG
jgi:hypothetical protein